MNSKTRESSVNRILRSAAKVVLCLMITVAATIPAALPEAVYAAQSVQPAAADSQANAKQTSAADSQANAKQTSTADSQANAKQTVNTSRTQSMSGMTLVFKRNVMSDERLEMKPGDLVANGKRKSVELNWSPVENPAGIDGYILLKKDPDTDTWLRIAGLEKTASSYTDEEACEPNVLYSYTIVAFKRTNGMTKVSEPADWAGAVTTRSDAKNVYECKVTNLANVVSVMAGSCAMPSLKFDNKAFSTEMRWFSSNNAVATVDETGLISGVAPGSAVIYAKSHTGTATSFDIHVTKPGSAQAMIDTFSAWMGYNRINGNQNGIIDIYNSVTPWPQGYKMRYSDAWCDATVSAAAIKTGNVDKIGRECSVPRHIDIFRKLGIWEEDGTITPKPGDIIVYSWRRFRQPNNASASHIGLVVKVENGEITCIEGNRGIGVVDTRTIPVGWGCIRGYARPHYDN